MSDLTARLRYETIPGNPYQHADLTRVMADAADEIERLTANLAAAWEAGHREPWKREMDACRCGAWHTGECGCGLYGTGKLISLDANPYKVKGGTE